MGEWDWDGKRAQLIKYRETVRGRQSEQRFIICICQLKQTLIQSSHLDQQKSDHSLCSEATVTSSVPTHLFLHKSKVIKAEFENKEIKTRKSFAILVKWACNGRNES